MSTPTRILALLVCGLFSMSVQGQTFEDVAISSGIDHVFHYGDFHFGGGTVVFDFNNDDYDDIYIAGGYLPDGLYENNRDGTFTNIFATSGLDNTASVITQGGASADFDNDGYRDLFICVRSYADSLNTHAPNLFYKNNGDGTFTDITSTVGLAGERMFSTSATFGDVNKDGFLDLYVGNWANDPIYPMFDSMGFFQDTMELGDPNSLYINNGGNTFSEVGASYGVDERGVPWAVAFFDGDNDGDVDVYNANDMGPHILPNSLFRNNYPNQNFTNIGASSGTNAAMQGMGVAVGDYDENGYMDLYITDVGSNYLYRNNTDETYTLRSFECQVENTEWWFGPSKRVSSIGWGAVFFDYNQDTYLDLFVCNGQLHPMLVGAANLDTLYNDNVLYRNDSSNVFSNVTDIEGVTDLNRSRGCAIIDYDNDGDMDLIVVNQINILPGYEDPSHPAKVRLYENKTSDSTNWFQLKLQGVTANKDGIGSRVKIEANGRTFIREVDGGSSYTSQNSTVVHFGLADIDMIDKLTVTWMGSGTVQTFDSIATDQRLELIEGDSLGVIFNDSIDNTGPPIVDGIVQVELLASRVQVYPNPFNQSLNVYLPEELLKEAPVLEIYDLLGARHLQDKQLNAGINDVDASNLAPGMYIYVLKAKGEVLKSGKIVSKR